MLTVLVVRFSSIGDVLLTTPLVRAMRRRHPEAHLVFVTKRGHVPLVADNPHLSGVVALEPGEAVQHLAARLRAISPTHGLDLQGSLRSRALRLLVRCSWSGYRKRRAARAALIGLKIDFYGRHVPVAERYFGAGRLLDVAPDDGPPELWLSEGARSRADQWLAEQQVDASSPLAALAPGAAHLTKRWPITHWSALAERLRDAGFTRVVVGGADDRGAAQHLAGLAHNAAGSLSLQETGALLARARVVVSGDTGVMHMATAVGTPVVALFGPTVRQFGFFPYRAPSTVLERPLPCRPCSTMGSARCPEGHHRCMVDLTPTDVVRAVEQLVG